MSDGEKEPLGPAFPRLATSLRLHNGENHSVYSIRSILHNYTRTKECGDFLAAVFFEDDWGEFAFFQKIARDYAVCLWRGDAKNYKIQNTWIGARDRDAVGHMMFMDIGATIEGLEFVKECFSPIEISV